MTIVFLTIFTLFFQTTPGPIQVGKPFPAVEFPVVKTIDGKEMTFESLKGKWVFLDFWATWCGPCIRELPVITKAVEEYGDRVVFISISMDDSWAEVEEFRKSSFPMKWNHMFLGADSPLIEQLNILTIPRPVLIAPDGAVAADKSGLRGELLLKVLEEKVGKTRSEVMKS